MRRRLRVLLARIGSARRASPQRDDPLRPAPRRPNPGTPTGSRISAAMPVGVLAAIALVDVALLGTRWTVISLFTVVPALALLGVPRAERCVRLGLATMAVTATLGTLRWERRPAVVATVLLGVALVSWIGWAVARSFQNQRRVLGDVRAVAETMQRAVLDPLPRQIGPLRLEARYLAAAPEAQVGGDFYAALSTSFGVRLILGDVCGHGMPAVQTAADALATFRDLAYLEPTLGGIALRMNLALRHPNHDRPFVAALLVEIPHGSGEATILCYGHAPPLLLHEGRAFHLDLRPHCLPLGLLQLQNTPCVAHTIELASGDGLLLSTDGVSEARDDLDRFYPLAERATALYRADADGLLDALQADLLRHTGGQHRDADQPGQRRRSGRLHDDAVLLLVRFDGQTLPEPRPEPDQRQPISGS